DTPDLDVPYILYGAGAWDFGLPNPAQLELRTNANIENVVVSGAHDFNAWNQLFTIFARDYLWKPEAFGDVDLTPGPTVYADEDSPTGYTARFVYHNPDATSVRFVADIMLRNWEDRSDTTVYSPFEYE